MRIGNSLYSAYPTFNQNNETSFSNATTMSQTTQEIMETTDNKEQVVVREGAYFTYEMYSKNGLISRIETTGRVAKLVG